MKSSMAAMFGKAELIEAKKKNPALKGKLYS